MNNMEQNEGTHIELVAKLVDDPKRTLLDLDPNREFHYEPPKEEATSVSEPVPIQLRFPSRKKSDLPWLSTKRKPNEDNEEEEDEQESEQDDAEEEDVEEEQEDDQETVVQAPELSSEIKEQQTHLNQQTGKVEFKNEKGTISVYFTNCTIKTMHFHTS